MVSETTRPIQDAPELVKPGRERRPYTLNEVVEFLATTSNRTDAGLKKVIAYLRAALEGDGVIDRGEATDLLVELLLTLETHSNALHTITLLNVSSSEVSLREVERIQNNEKNAKKR